MLNILATDITSSLKTKIKRMSFISFVNKKYEKKKRQQQRSTPLDRIEERRTTILIFLRCHGTRCSFIVTGADSIESGLDFLYPRRSRPALRFHCNTHGFSIGRYR